ncbi:GntR family transcriptional regulator [Streptomyces sp. A73]|uniref:GntR family transcriptional regulator n=1 Tax=unclassified Streptomyces TaxID=2593676 RepID=UPI001B35EBA3|nr:MULTISPECIES: GntR family transcriptional regulator [unclassified Streptomyces]MBQ0868482.1 GntR family transcriptional regulator [Streptomyces sp. RK75]MBQ1119203.1 GntR family transcriptional regulator [Streptomyces sp. B15]MBQ1160706.1 GntR family transcriptional regulator [Streptomyces sp. A73]
MTPPPHDTRPPYQQAADEIRKEIKSGRLKPGEQLPSHRELQERFGVANMTARSALRVLRDEGLIYTVQGRGSYVADAVVTQDGEVVAVVEAKSSKRPEAAKGAEGPAAPDASEATGPYAATLLAIRDQLRTLNAEVQTLKRDVAELKEQRDQGYPTR